MAEFFFTDYFRMKKFYILSIILFTFFASCSNDQTTIQIIRNPQLTFSLSASNGWTASNYSITEISKVVVYPQDPNLGAQLYNRYSLQGTGKDDSGKTYQLVITFDVSDSSQLVGVYAPSYNSQRGLAQVQLYNLTDKNDLSVYQLCAENLNTAVFQIQKQKPDERIVTGAFQMMLCNSRDTTQKLSITAGSLKDLKY